MYRGMFLDLQFSFWFSPHNKWTCIIAVMPAGSKVRTQENLSKLEVRTKALEQDCSLL